MRCSKCDRELSPGDVYCPGCGQEVQIVPDYDPLDEMLWDKAEEKSRKKKEEGKGEDAGEEPARKEHKNGRSQKRSLPFWKDAWFWRVLLSVAALAVCTGILFGSYHYITSRKDYGYQLRKGMDCYESGRLEEAIPYLKQAWELLEDTEGGDLRPLLYLARVYRELDEAEMAADTFERVLSLTSLPMEEKEKTEIYGEFFQTLNEAGRTGEINGWIEECPEESLKKKLLPYRIEKPEASISGGVYHYYVYPELTAPYGTIYYTLDGSTPTQDSKEYTEKIPLVEGDNLLTAVAVNEKGIVSEPLFVVYTLDFDVPDIPDDGM